MKRVPPALVLYFLAPAVGELLSGSAPPVEFFHPFGLLIMPALYGSGAILVRETALRWEKRWPTILVLGLAYGIVEEGLMVKSFFDPAWQDLGLLAEYGRWAGVNWVWSYFLSIYHAIYSISIPIMLVELLYPERRGEPWIGRRGMIGFSLLLLADVLFGFFFLTPYRPPVVPYLLALVAVAALCLIARRMPRRWAEPIGTPRCRPLWFGLLGFGGTLAFFLMHWVTPEIGVPVFLNAAVMLGVLIVMFFTIRWTSGEGAWSDMERLALVSGALTFFILWAPLAEFDANRPDNPVGMTIVGLAAGVFLIWLRNRSKRRLRDEAAFDEPGS